MLLSIFHLSVSLSPCLSLSLYLYLYLSIYFVVFPFTVPVSVSVAEAGDVDGGAAQDDVLGDVPHHRHHVRRVVAVRSHRPHDGGGEARHAGVAVLD